MTGPLTPTPLNDPWAPREPLVPLTVEPPDDPAWTDRRGGVTGAVVYLTLRSAVNRFTRQLQRLRSPRTIIALVVVVLYGWTLLFSADPGTLDRPGILSSDTAARLVTLGVFLSSAYYWIIGSETRALNFTPAEVQFLFAAPLTRQQLVRYRLLRAQAVIFVSVLIWTFFLRRTGDGVDLILRPIALWVLFCTTYLHRLGATLVRVGTVGHGGAGVRRLGIPLALFGASAVAVLWSAFQAWPASGIRVIGDLAPMIERMTSAPAAAIALLPARLVVAPVYATTTAEWMAAIGPALLLVVLHFVWVVRTDSAFEESAATAAAARATRVTQLRTGAPGPGGLARRLTARLPLAPTGQPAVAILWKNMLGGLRTEKLMIFIIILPLIAVGLFLARDAMVPRVRTTVAGMATAWALMALALGPSWVRSDLRRDLLKLDLLRSWPLAGDAVVGASIASSALLLSVLQFATWLIVIAATGDLLIARFGPTLFAAGAVAMVVALPPINLITSTIHNGLALLFPAWVHLGAERPSGFEAMGQLYVMLLATVVLLLVLLALPAGAAMGVHWLLEATLGAWALPLSAAAAGLVVLFEVWMAVDWLGGVYERTEPTAIGAA